MSQNESLEVKKNSTRKFLRRLLTTTCLTVAAASEVPAATILEVNVTGGDFSNTFSGANQLPLGTNSVQGTISSGADIDYFQFTDLTPGVAFAITASAPPNTYLNFEVFDSAQTGFPPLSQFFYSAQAARVTGTVPLDGILVAEVFNSEGIGSYTVDLVTPEPGTWPLTGLGLALAGAWRRRKSTKSQGE